MPSAHPAQFLSSLPSAQPKLLEPSQTHLMGRVREIDTLHFDETFDTTTTMQFGDNQISLLGEKDT